MYKKKFDNAKLVLRCIRKQHREAGLHNKNFVQDYTYSEEQIATKTIGLVFILLFYFPFNLLTIALFSIPASLLFLLVSPFSGQTIQSCIFLSIIITSAFLYLSFATSSKKRIKADFLKKISKSKCLSKQGGKAEQMIRSRDPAFPSIAIGFNSLNAKRDEAVSGIFALSVVCFLSFTMALSSWINPSSQISFLQFIAPLAILFDSIFSGILDVVGLSGLKQMGEQPTWFKLTIFVTAAVFGFLFARYHSVVISIRLRELPQEHLDFIFEDAPDDVRQYLLEVY